MFHINKKVTSKVQRTNSWSHQKGRFYSKLILWR